MELLLVLFGIEHHVTPAQICARALLLFAYGVLMLRLSGRRTFAEWSGLDVIIVVMAGSAMGRAMMGAGSLPGALAAVALLVLLHRALSWAVAKSPALAGLVEGEAALIACDGVIDEARRLRHNISQAEIAAAMREKGLSGLEEIGRVRAIFLEPTGDIHVLLREP
jgi:uncharacterized membrane protein YcaP (DUF421 family)